MTGGHRVIDLKICWETSRQWMNEKREIDMDDRIWLAEWKGRQKSVHGVCNCKCILSKRKWKGRKEQDSQRRRRGRKREKSRDLENELRHNWMWVLLCRLLYEPLFHVFHASRFSPTTKRKNEPPSLCYCLFQPLSFFASLFLSWSFPGEEDKRFQRQRSMRSHMQSRHSSLSKSSSRFFFLFCSKRFLLINVRFSLLVFGLVCRLAFDSDVGNNPDITSPPFLWNSLLIILCCVSHNNYYVTREKKTDWNQGRNGKDHMNEWNGKDTTFCPPGYIIKPCYYKICRKLCL